ncbi:hypothetical protein [Arenimonas alkanexedens]
MQFLIVLLTQWRRHMLARQAVIVRQAVSAMNADQRKQTTDITLAEIQAASRLPLPHLHGDNDTTPYRPWTPVAAIAAARAKDRSIQLRQRSIALWLAVVYHETRGAPHEGLVAVHREVLGILRELKDHKPTVAAEQAWFNQAA